MTRSEGALDSAHLAWRKERRFSQAESGDWREPSPENNALAPRRGDSIYLMEQLPELIRQRSLKRLLSVHPHPLPLSLKTHSHRTFIGIPSGHYAYAAAYLSKKGQQRICMWR